MRISNRRVTWFIARVDRPRAESRDQRSSRYFRTQKLQSPCNSFFATVRNCSLTLACVDFRHGPTVDECNQHYRLTYLLPVPTYTYVYLLIPTVDECNQHYRLTYSYSSCFVSTEIWVAILQLKSLAELFTQMALPLIYCHIITVFEGHSEITTFLNMHSMTLSLRLRWRMQYRLWPRRLSVDIYVR